MQIEPRLAATESPLTSAQQRSSAAESGFVGRSSINRRHGQRHWSVVSRKSEPIYVGCHSRLSPLASVTSIALLEIDATVSCRSDIFQGRVARSVAVCMQLGHRI